MKNIFGRSMLKSVGISLMIFLAFSAIVICIHASIGTSALKPIINGVETCGEDKEKCMWDEWDKDPESNLWKLEDKLNKNYPKYHQGTTLFANYISNRSAVVWFNLYRSVVIYAAGIGIVVGIVLNLIYSRKLAQEEAAKVSKSKGKKKSKK